MTQKPDGEDIAEEIIKRIKRLNALVDLGGSNRSKMKFKCRSSELAMILNWIRTNGKG